MKYKNRKTQTKYIDYKELPEWIRKAEDKINKKGVDEVLFGDIE